MNKELIQFVEWLPNNSEEFSGLTVDESITKINEMITSDEGKQTLEQLTNKYKGKEMGLFKEGGKLGYLLCLKKGGSVDCGCGKKQEGGEITQQDKAKKSAQKISKPIEKAQGGTDGLRQRGVADANSGNVRPKYNSDSTWVWNRGAEVNNVFDGTTLHQNVVTLDENGTPRRTVRVIRNYDLPTQSDTIYIDARGVEGRRNSTFLDRLLGNVHSENFMNALDNYLEGMEPKYLSEKEVKSNKNRRK